MWWRQDIIQFNNKLVHHQCTDIKLHWEFNNYKWPKTYISALFSVKIKSAHIRQHTLIPICDRPKPANAISRPIYQLDYYSNYLCFMFVFCCTEGPMKQFLVSIKDDSVYCVTEVEYGGKRVVHLNCVHQLFFYAFAQQLKCIMFCCRKITCTYIIHTDRMQLSIFTWAHC